MMQIAIVTCGLPKIPVFQKYLKNHVPMHICVCKFGFVLSLYVCICGKKKRKIGGGGGFMVWMI